MEQFYLYYISWNIIRRFYNTIIYGHLLTNLLKAGFVSSLIEQKFPLNNFFSEFSFAISIGDKKCICLKFDLEKKLNDYDAKKNIFNRKKAKSNFYFQIIVYFFIVGIIIVLLLYLILVWKKKMKTWPFSLVFGS